MSGLFRSHPSSATPTFNMFQLALVVVVAVAYCVLADCTPIFTEGASYTVSMSDPPGLSWVDNSTIGFLGVDLVHMSDQFLLNPDSRLAQSSEVHATEWYLTTTPFEGYVFSQVVSTAFSPQLSPFSEIQRRHRHVQLSLCQ
jgi:hypothetical protein